MNSAMLDIETLGTGSDSAVISVGLVAFSEDAGIIASTGWAIRPEDWHGHIDPKTVKWWMSQNEAAQHFSFGGVTQDYFVAQAIASFVHIHKIEEVWANDPDFDVVILKNWWSRVAATHTVAAGFWPFKYNQSRSFRTITAEAKRLGINYDHIYDHKTVAHNPIDDAANQARVVNWIRAHLVKAER